ncbi:WAP protein, partial [Hirundo rustica]|nr:WAP protein [Hirundo rustica]
KPGACPAAAPQGLIAPCSFPCLEDKDCLGAQKCCPLGCGSACLEPAQEKPGICPLADEAPLAPCGTTCTKDWQCPGAEKCCNSSRCGYVCSAPEPDKPGECPKVRPQHPPGPCTETDSCTHDRDCSRQEKCCFSGCAMR